jgi:hypothetical protein
MHLKGKRIAILAENLYQEMELWVPYGGQGGGGRRRPVLRLQARLPGHGRRPGRRRDRRGVRRGNRAGREGKRVTSFFSIKDDMMNAGGQWSDSEVVVDGNLITSRKPDDLPAFCREIIRALVKTA